MEVEAPSCTESRVKRLEPKRQEDEAEAAEPRQTKLLDGADKSSMLKSRTLKAKPIRAGLCTGSTNPKSVKSKIKRDSSSWQVPETKNGRPGLARLRGGIKGPGRR